MVRSQSSGSVSTPFHDRPGAVRSREIAARLRAVYRSLYHNTIIVSVIGYATEIKAIKTRSRADTEREVERKRKTHIFLSLSIFSRDVSIEGREGEESEFKDLKWFFRIRSLRLHMPRTIRAPFRQTGNERRSLLTYRDLECFVRGRGSPPDRRSTFKRARYYPIYTGEPSPPCLLRWSLAHTPCTSMPRGRASS